MTIHLVTRSFFADKFTAHDGDVFLLTGKGSGVDVFGLADTTLVFLGQNEKGLIEADEPHTGATTIVDAGHGTYLNIIEGTGDVTIYDFQHDKTGYIHAQLQSPITVHLTASSDGHGGTYLSAPGLKIDLVGDTHVLASQHS